MPVPSPWQECCAYPALQVLILVFLRVFARCAGMHKCRGRRDAQERPSALGVLKGYAKRCPENITLIVTRIDTTSITDKNTMTVFIHGFFRRGLFSFSTTVSINPLQMKILVMLNDQNCHRKSSQCPGLDKKGQIHQREATQALTGLKKPCFWTVITGQNSS